MLFIIGNVFSSVLNAEPLTGTVVPPYPNGLQSTTGACVAHALGLIRACDYSVSDLRYADKQPHAILLKKKVASKGNKPVWRVTDQIDYPPIKPGEFLAISTCKLNDEADPAILAVVAEQDEEWLKASTWAARVDLEKGTIGKISPQGIVCENGLWGI
jgi:hypothetical protein